MIVGSKYLGHLSPGRRVPAHALVLAGAIPALIALCAPWMQDAVATIISFAAIGIYIAFQMIVFAALVARTRGWHGQRLLLLRCGPRGRRDQPASRDLETRTGPLGEETAGRVTASAAFPRPDAPPRRRGSIAALVDRIVEVVDAGHASRACARRGRRKDDHLEGDVDADAAKLMIVATASCIHGAQSAMSAGYRASQHQRMAGTAGRATNARGTCCRRSSHRARRRTAVGSRPPAG